MATVDLLGVVGSLVAEHTLEAVERLPLNGAHFLGELGLGADRAVEQQLELRVLALELLDLVLYLWRSVLVRLDKRHAVPLGVLSCLLRVDSRLFLRLLL